MLIQYFNNPELAYTTRKRYSSIPYSPFNTEEQFSVLLGDGATTFVKTSKDNLCNYVIIDDTRWFVVSYQYMNGGQITLNLQRDVIGEFGLENCYGKVERGLTNNFNEVLSRKKELSLNQILKRRVQIRPTDTLAGTYTRSLSSNEKWGILYITKPTDGKDFLNINIPEFTPEISTTLPSIAAGKSYYRKLFNGRVSFHTIISYRNSNSSVINNSLYFCEIELGRDFTYNPDGDYPEFYIKKASSEFRLSLPKGSNVGSSINATSLIYTTNIDINTEAYAGSFVDAYVENCANRLLGNNIFYEPDYDPVTSPNRNEYNNVVIFENDNYYLYSVSENSVEDTYYRENSDRSFLNIGGSERITLSDGSYKEITIGKPSLFGATDTDIYANAYDSLYSQNVSKRIITEGDAGQLTLEVSAQVINEPYIIMAIPLFDTTITKGSERYVVDDDKAFRVFNTIIQYMSGTNGYLVDAQIYPYCPPLLKVATVFQENVPIFYISSNTYTHNCVIDLDVYEDIKKEYICREYSIVSPEQSNKFSFNFYDYKNSKSPLTISVKTSLKPFSIVSSAVIIRDENSLIGINYSSDLKGSQPTANGFEVSLSTDQFQQYVRNNSSYEKIFNKNQDYLRVQQETERQNEVVQGVVNTITATTMGSIGGASVGGAFGKKGEAIGAIIGGSIMGTTTAAAMIAQSVINEKLRNYEYNMQKELFDLNIAQIKNLPNQISRISSFNEIIMKDFWFILETYECSEYEKELVDEFLNRYSYSLGVYGYFINFYKEGRFLKGNLITSNYNTNLHNIANNELQGGIYYYGS